MAKASGVTFRLDVAVVPFMAHARELAAREIVTGAGATNKEYTDPMLTLKGECDLVIHSVLTDPQTSGGLLMAAPRDKAEEMVRELKDKGYGRSVIIGEVLAKGERPLIVNY
jgi:selenide,water dikinase